MHVRICPIYDKGPPFSVIIFSSRFINDPIDYAYTLENLASEGFVVAARQPMSTIRRMTFALVLINEQAGFQLLDCLDEEESRRAQGLTSAQA